MSFLTTFSRWLGRSAVLADRTGDQLVLPASPLVENTQPLGPDSALQLATLYRCVDLLSKTISTLPLFVYERDGAGQRRLARNTVLWSLMHDAPNASSTASEFWGAMVLNFLLRGNAYARVQRNDRGDPVALWPMSSEQVVPYIDPETGVLFYEYQRNTERWLLPAEEVLHVRDTGNGIVGLSRIDFMRASINEAARAQAQATRLFSNGNKPTGLLMVPAKLSDDQRARLRQNFGEIASGLESRLFILEADMKYQPISLSPNDVQLLETRRFSVEEICRWFGVPPVLVGHSNVTTWGSGIEQILDGFYKLTVRPMLTVIEQAIARRVLTPAMRSRYTVEFSFDALLRANIRDRMEVYAKAVQNGIMTRNEARQLENLPLVDGGDVATAQTNLAPLHMLGQVGSKGATDALQDPVSQ
jgi:HK97 family phage portal protein